MKSRTCLVIFLAGAAGCVAKPAAPPEESLSTRGIGKIQVGAPQAMVARALGMPAEAAPTVGGCITWRPAGIPAGMRLMLEDGRVVRADVDSGAVRTDRGAGIGTAEAELAKLYPGAQTLPHKYRYAEGWHTIVYRPTGAADSASRFVFETDGHTVQSFRTGIEPAVEYVEGCG